MGTSFCFTDNTIKYMFSFFYLNLRRVVMDNDEGTYACEAKREVPEFFQVHVRDPPYFTTRPRRYYQEMVGKTISIVCEANGNPTPTLEWRKVNGEIDMKGPLIEGGRLVIADLKREDKGYFECIAKNSVATIVTSTLLIIEAVPSHKVLNVTFETAETSLYINWLPAFDSDYSELQDYFVWYRVIGRSNWTTVFVPKEQTSVAIQSLQPDTEYEFVILSRNSLGNGLFSRKFRVKTNGSGKLITNVPQNQLLPERTLKIPAATPPFPPRNVTVRPEKNYLIIRWLPPKNQTIAVHYYKVHYRTVGKLVALSEKIRNKTFYKWFGFSRGAQYRFKVKSYHNNTPSNTIEEILYDTGDPLNEGVKISKAAIGGIVGGLAFLAVAVLLALCSVKEMLNTLDQRVLIVEKPERLPADEVEEESNLGESEFNHVLCSHNHLPILSSDQTSEYDRVTYDHISTFSAHLTPMAAYRSRDSLKGSVKETPI
ncbi:DgyrCDS10049 [Dimorphilus gyrociliatus]|uniref:DgyrCDS10049 n=1 Tax=Dimorphilus gyrociliatus TaxID=2664684 RepID=A0A7I8W1M2_9ANNE|nr:DgyrCDS10049 [Dimorphilus gyrociliatus]